MISKIGTEPTFGYKSPIKQIVTHCAYTGRPFSKHNKPTFEHIKPHSRGGHSRMSNCLVTTQKSNSDRGSMPFYKWLLKFPHIAKNIQNYLDGLRGVKINGIDYVEAVKPTLNKEARGVVVFKGRVK